jgi:hypothetical protein
VPTTVSQTPSNRLSESRQDVNSSENSEELTSDPTVAGVFTRDLVLLGPPRMRMAP